MSDYLAKRACVEIDYCLDALVAAAPYLKHSSRLKLAYCVLELNDIRRVIEAESGGEVQACLFL